jgi:quercetin dioxygenase-like cupin family protein
MEIRGVPFCTTDWDKVAVTEHPGEAGTAFWRTLEAGNIRVRMVEYTPGYLADGWCSRGHVLLVLEGTVVTELDDGRSFILSPGMSFQVADDETPHRTRTEKGAKLFVVE